MTKEQQRQIQGLGMLVQLEKQIRAAEDEDVFGFVVVNETHHLAPYRQAVLWRDGASGRVAAVSGLPSPDGDAPYVQWLNRLLKHLARKGGAGIRRLAADELPEAVGREWAEWLPAHGLWAPLATADGALMGGLLLARDGPWLDHELPLLEHVTEAYAHAWKGLRPRPRWRPFEGIEKNRLKLVVAVVAFAALWMPVRLSVLAPAEVAPLKPAVVRAPLDGVVDRFHVEASQEVTENQLLLTLDKTDLTNKLAVAEQKLAVARAAYRQASQRAVFDSKSKARPAILKGRMDIEAAEAAHVKELLMRADVRAPHAGIAVFADVNDWIGRPVKIGERILTIADPTRAELEIQLPVSDAIVLKPGSDVVLFLDVAPAQPTPATLRTAAYEAELTPEGVLAYKLKATFASGEPPRIGLRGTAKIYGERVPLIYLVMRRPFAAARQWLGW